MVHLLLKTIWQFLKQLDIELSYDPAIPFRYMPKRIENKDSHTYLYTSEHATFTYRDNLKKLWQTGVKMCGGTDLIIPGAPQSPMWMELGYMFDFGIPALEVLKIGTRNGAEVLGIENETGSLQVGLAGDVLVCRGDASQDVHCLRAVREVYLGGAPIHEPYRPT